MQRLRRVLGFDASTLAKRAQLPATTLTELEAGQREPTFAEIHGLAAGLGISVGTLFRVCEQQREFNGD